jgi:hypothetical protein
LFSFQFGVTRPPTTEDSCMSCLCTFIDTSQTPDSI